MVVHLLIILRIMCSNIKMSDTIKIFLISTNVNEFASIIINFTIGFALGATSWSLIYYLCFVLFYEIIIMHLNSAYSVYWHPLFRLGYICGGLLGYIISRFIGNRFTTNPLDTGYLITNTQQ